MKAVPTRQGVFLTWDTGTVTRALESRGDWDEHVGAILQEARPGGLALDLGAHIGWFSVQLATRHDRVIACEPYLRTVDLLRQNVRGFPVDVWPVAAYSQPQTLTFADWLEPTDRGANCYVPGIGRAGMVVPAVALDPYFALGEIDPPDRVSVIKTDCQGADLHALIGLHRVIERCRPLIVFEWEEALAAHHGHTWTDYQDWCATHRYTLDRITPDFWDYVARPREGLH